MIELSEHSNVNYIKRVYFLSHCYAKGGGSLFFFRLMEYLLKYTQIGVGIIDYKDGILARTAHKLYPNAGVAFVDYTDLVWNVDSNSCIVVPDDRLGLIRQLTDSNVRILHYFWNQDIGWSLLYERKVFKKLAKLLYHTNACAFMEYGSYIYASKAFKKNFKRTYIPLFFQAEESTKTRRYRKSDEINLVWLGRLSGTKTISLLNIIENFFNYKTGKKKIIHIIGNGTDVDAMKRRVVKYQHDIKFLFKGLLTGDELNKYLAENTDVGIAMGTSMLHFAALKLPVIGAHSPQKGGPFCIQTFKWLFDMHEYSLGSPMNEEGVDPGRFKNIDMFDNMLNQIMDEATRQRYGDECYEYYKNIHADIEFIGGKLMEALQQTTLTFEKLKKCFHFIPYGGDKGIAVHTYKIGFPIFKTIHHLHRVRYYFCGIEIARKQRIRGHNKWRILGIEFSQNWWGRFNFPQRASEETRNQCKDVYACDKRLFEKGGSNGCA